MTQTKNPVADAATNGVGPDRKFSDIASRWSLPLMMLDRDLKFVYANTAYLTSTKSQWADLNGRYVFDAFPDTKDRVAAVHAAFMQCLDGAHTRLDAQPFMLTRDDGTEEQHYWQAVQEPVFGTDGTVTHLVQYAEDVTQRVAAEQARDLITQELNHRVKNVLSVIQSLARLTSRGQTSVAGYAGDFAARIDAMSRNHARLYDNQFTGSHLRSILQDELRAMAAGGDDAAFTLTGNPLQLDANLSRDVSMVVHELATNAAKYGCFSKADGRLSVTWTSDGPVTTLNWVERGVGPVTAPTTTGFGTKLLQSMSTIECNKHYTEDGITVTLRINHAGA